MSENFLVGICYHEPESFAQWNAGLIEDYESSTGIFVLAESEDVALTWGDEIATQLHRIVNNDMTLDWRSNYSCWIEREPALSAWKHCLGFFQSVEVGEHPDYDHMGTNAYVLWLKAQRKHN